MADVKITVRTDGPLRVEGPVTIVDPEGREYTAPGRGWISLCRCGLSEKKPFCDGAHKRQGFHHEPHAFELAPPLPKP